MTGFILWRRRTKAQKAIETALEKPISPFDINGASPINSAPSSPGWIAVNPSTPTLGHSGFVPQSGGADVRLYTHSNTSIDLGPGGIANPFNDQATISTMSTNVIPIAYVPPSSASMSLSDGHNPPGSPTTPSRPARTPGLDLRLPPSAISRASLMSPGGNNLLAPKNPYADSVRSGFSTASSVISSSSSVLYDRPTIVTNAKVGRQVLGVMRAEVVPVPSQSTPSGTSLRSRTSVRSPLAGGGFTARDIEDGPVPPLPTPGSPTSSTRSDPFSDMKSPNMHAHFNPLSPTSAPLPESRLPSPAQQAFDESHTSALSPDVRSRLLTNAPPTASGSRHFPRESTSSFVSSTSRADSIMNGFTFMPPTPSSAQVLYRTGPPSSFGSSEHQHQAGPSNTLVRRPTTHSVMSASSGMSSGLDAFPFEFGVLPMGNAPSLPESTRNTLAAASHSNALGVINRGGSAGPSMPLPRSVYPGGGGAGDGQRASLDTLALSRDVDAYALPYDR